MPATPGPETPFIERRPPQAPEILAPATARWLAMLPPRAKPTSLPVYFARIANALSGKWSNAEECLAYLDDLLIDKRGNRTGFPVPILLELAALKNHIETKLRPAPQTVWEQIADRGGRRERGQDAGRHR